jgi:hypothetical protein
MTDKPYYRVHAENLLEPCSEEKYWKIDDRGVWLSSVMNTRQCPSWCRGHFYPVKGWSESGESCFPDCPAGTFSPGIALGVGRQGASHLALKSDVPGIFHSHQKETHIAAVRFLK